MSIYIIILWVIATFTVGSIAGILGKRLGVEYPIALVSSLVVMANIFANKIVMFGPFTVSAGVIVFSMTFFITDIISEHWGPQMARKAVWSGFYSGAILILSTYFVVNWTPAVYAVEISEMFTEVFALTPRIVVASFIAYVISQNNDIWLFHYLKQKTNGNHMWLRNNLSTMTSQLIDSTIFVFIAFYGVFPIGPLILGQWLIKVVIAMIDTPFLYTTITLMGKIPEKVYEAYRPEDLRIEKPSEKIKEREEAL